MVVLLYYELRRKIAHRLIIRRTKMEKNYTYYSVTRLLASSKTIRMLNTVKTPVVLL